MDVDHVVIWNSTTGEEIELEPIDGPGMTLSWDENGVFTLTPGEAQGR